MKTLSFTRTLLIHGVKDDAFTKQSNHIQGNVYTGPVGTFPYGTDWNCLTLSPLYRVYTGSVPKSSNKEVGNPLFFKARMEFFEFNRLDVFFLSA